MKTSDLMDKILDLPEPQHDRPAVPPMELIAFCIRHNRGLLHWKQSTLADFAGVSLSTVERVERAEKVNDASLDAIARAFGYEDGYFTTPRTPLDEIAAERKALEYFDNLVVVPVGPLDTQRAIRQLANTHGYIVHHPSVHGEQHAEIDTLIDWIDIASTYLSDWAIPNAEPLGGRRKLYGDILEAIRRIEHSGFTVLSGTVSEPTKLIPNWTVGVVSITSKSSDPGAIKREFVLVDRQALKAPLQN